MRPLVYVDPIVGRSDVGQGDRLAFTHAIQVGPIVYLKLRTPGAASLCLRLAKSAGRARDSMAWHLRQLYWASIQVLRDGHELC